MPVHPCSRNGKSGYQYGKTGKCYTGPGARKKAERQAAAIRASGYVENSAQKGNPLLLDPTRTVTLRRGFHRGTVKAFRGLRSALTALVLVEDAFGLSGGASQSGSAPRTTGNSSDVGVDRGAANGPAHYNTAPVSNKRWAYSSNEEAADQFEKWLKGQVRKELLSETEAVRWRRYIARGFEKGANRALVDVTRGKGKGAKAVRFLDRTRAEDFVEGQREAFLRTTLGRSTAVEKLRLLQSTALSEVRGLADDLVSKGRRVLVDGLVRNLSPREVAARLSKVLKVSEGRARTIANTELVRAHAEGQLEAMAQLGVEKVGVAVEWSSLASACPLCSPLNHVVLTLAEARGMLPRHPNCRCAWRVANVYESKEEKKVQKRSKTKVDKAVKQSQREGGDSDDWGPAKEIARSRPVLNCSCTEAEVSFSALLKRLGVG